MQTSFLSEVQTYVGRIREFTRQDWWIYIGWVGLMLGLVFATSGFLLVGHYFGAVRFPGEAWWVPVGSALFSVSIAIDTIGHRTIYKKEIQVAEGLVHGITILCGITSCLALCLAYSMPAFWIPAMVLTVFSFIYSLVDEVFHWYRYVRSFSDRVEMWSHVGILVGHSTMMLGWWAWYFQGYSGVAQTVALLGL